MAKKQPIIAILYDFDKTLATDDMQNFSFIPALGMTSDEFCERLLESQHVAIVPGSAFGESGEGFVRASYCYSIEHIREALHRIELFLKEIKG